MTISPVIGSSAAAYASAPTGATFIIRFERLFTPNPTHIAAQASVVFEVNSGSGCYRLETTLLPSRPEEFHPEPLTDPDVNLSIHPARVTAGKLPPSADVLGSSQFDPVRPSQRRLPAPFAPRAFPRFITTTGQCAPLRCIGTFGLAVVAACAFSLTITGQVLTFHTKAQLSFAPSTCRMPLGQYQDIPPN